MKHTIESVKADLAWEFAKLSANKYSAYGDVNMEEFGGVKFRKLSAISNTIEAIYFIGLESLTENDSLQNKHEVTIDLEGLLNGVEEIWVYSDIENCGLDIGSAILGLQSYSNFLGLNN